MRRSRMTGVVDKVDIMEDSRKSPAFLCVTFLFDKKVTWCEGRSLQDAKDYDYPFVTVLTGGRIKKVGVALCNNDGDDPITPAM